MIVKERMIGNTRIKFDDSYIVKDKSEREAIDHQIQKICWKILKDSVKK